MKKRLFCFIIILSILLVFSSSTSIQTYSRENSVNINLKEVKYGRVGKIITEYSVVVIGNESIEIKKRVYPDNTFDVSMETSNGNKIQKSGQCDYRVYVVLLLEQQNKSGTVIGKDIEGSQFKHIKLSSYVETINDKQMKWIR